VKSSGSSTTLKIILCFMVAFVLGGLSTFVLQIFAASFPSRGASIGLDRKQPVDLHKTVLVKPGYLLPQDQWVLNYSVSFSIVDSLPLKEDNMYTTMRTYGLVVFRKKDNSLVGDLPNKPASFWIAGLKEKGGRNRFVWLGISPENLVKDSETIFYKLVDFPAKFYKPAEIYVDGELELQSDDSSKYGEWFKKQ
jgi:hypothetical protein